MESRIQIAEDKVLRKFSTRIGQKGRNGRLLQKLQRVQVQKQTPGNEKQNFRTVCERKHLKDTNNWIQQPGRGNQKYIGKQYSTNLNRRPQQKVKRDRRIVRWFKKEIWSRVRKVYEITKSEIIAREESFRPWYRRKLRANGNLRPDQEEGEWSVRKNQ